MSSAKMKAPTESEEKPNPDTSFTSEVTVDESDKALIGKPDESDKTQGIKCDDTLVAESSAKLITDDDDVIKCDNSDVMIEGTQDVKFKSDDSPATESEVKPVVDDDSKIFDEIKIHDTRDVSNAKPVVNDDDTNSSDTKDLIILENYNTFVSKNHEIPVIESQEKIENVAKCKEECKSTNDSNCYANINITEESHSDENVKYKEKSAVKSKEKPSFKSDETFFENNVKDQSVSDTFKLPADVKMSEESKSDVKPSVKTEDKSDAKSNAKPATKLDATLLKNNEKVQCDGSTPKFSSDIEMTEELRFLNDKPIVQSEENSAVKCDEKPTVKSDNKTLLKNGEEIFIDFQPDSDIEMTEDPKSDETLIVRSEEKSDVKFDEKSSIDIAEESFDEDEIDDILKDIDFIDESDDEDDETIHQNTVDESSDGTQATNGTSVKIDTNHNNDGNEKQTSIVPTRCLRVDGFPSNVSLTDIKYIVSHHMSRRYLSDFSLEYTRRNIKKIRYRTSLTVSRKDPNESTCKLHFKNIERSTKVFEYLKSNPILEGHKVTAEYDEPDDDEPPTTTKVANCSTKSATCLDVNVQRLRNFLKTSACPSHSLVVEGVPLHTHPMHIADVIKNDTQFKGECFFIKDEPQKPTCRIYFQSIEECFELYKKLQIFYFKGKKLRVRLESGDDLTVTNKDSKIETPQKEFWTNSVLARGFPTYWSQKQVRYAIIKQCDYLGRPMSFTKPDSNQAAWKITLLSGLEAEFLKNKLNALCINGEKITAILTPDPVHAGDKLKPIKRAYNDNSSQDGGSENPTVKKLKTGENCISTTSTPCSSNAANCEKDPETGAFSPYKDKRKFWRKCDFDNETFGLSREYLDGLGLQFPLGTTIRVRNLNNLITQENDGDLRRVFSMAGHVRDIRVMKKKPGNPDKMETYVNVDYDHPLEAVQAISMFHKRVLCGCEMWVRQDYRGKNILLPPGLESVGPGFGPNGAPLTCVRQLLQLQPLKQALKELGKEIISELDPSEHFAGPNTLKSITQPERRINENRQIKDMYQQANTNNQAQNQNPDLSTVLQTQLLNAVQSIVSQVVPGLQSLQANQIAAQQNFAQPPLNFAQPPLNFAQPPLNFAQPPLNFAQPPLNFATQNPPSFAPNLVQNVHNMPSFIPNLTQNVQYAHSFSSNVAQAVQITPSFTHNQPSLSPSIVTNQYNVPPGPGNPPQEPPKRFGGPPSYKPAFCNASNVQSECNTSEPTTDFSISPATQNKAWLEETKQMDTQAIKAELESPDSENETKPAPQPKKKKKRYDKRRNRGQRLPDGTRLPRYKPDELRKTYLSAENITDLTSGQNAER